MLLILCGFGIAWSLDPSPTGRGTHQQLGLPPCTILLTFQFPCPTCGMTTSFSHFVRGEWGGAVRSNASGFLLALGCLAYLPWATVSLLKRELIWFQCLERTTLALMLVWLLVMFLEWGWRIGLL